MGCKKSISWGLSRTPYNFLDIYSCLISVQNNFQNVQPMKNFDSKFHKRSLSFELHFCHNFIAITILYYIMGIKIVRCWRWSLSNFLLLDMLQGFKLGGL